MLRIAACEASHSGKYTCQVANEAGQDRCFSILTVQGIGLHIQQPIHKCYTTFVRSYCFCTDADVFVCLVEPPQIPEKPEVIKVTVGDPVSLDCKVTGSPQLKVKWMKNGKELQSIRQHKLSFENNVSRLLIQSAQSADGGEYIFEVANHISSCSCNVKLIVLGWCKHK